ncbi:CMGC/DYRK protein kinase [Apiospora kogelbergensis]|uniref:CMGC/DYRK protein kinase n=1 Tax=Apiospora kogelbergensis TaxID=1337665 RepID=UPI003131F3D9
MGKAAQHDCETPITPTNSKFDDYPTGGNKHESHPTDDSHDGSTSDNHSSRLTSDGVSSVTTVSDLGFDAAPLPFSQPNCTCALHGSDKNDLFDHYMTPEELQNTSISNQTWNEPGHNEYLPLNALEALFCKQSINSIIRESSIKDMSPDELKSKVRMIYRIDTNGSRPSRRRILVVLTMMNRVKYIDKFIEHGVWDTDLPIEQSKMRFSDLFRYWDSNDKILLTEYQNRISIPFFDFRHDKLPYYHFNDEIRLPWVEYKRKSVGGTGMVHKIMIHPSHHNFVSDKACIFDNQEDSTQDTMSYKNELRALELALGRTQSEKHLIKLLLTFQQGGRSYLVFDWADGNLQEFWDQKTIEVSQSNNIWIVKQCHGLATALKRIHGLATFQKEERKKKPNSESDEYREYGRHGDIKAANILWFKDYQGNHNHFVLADLGLTRYHSHLTRSQTLGPTTSHKKYDIWSLGCVFLEFFIWYVLGAADVNNFETQLDIETKGEEAPNFGEANFFNINEDANGKRFAVVKPAVKKWIRMIKSHGNCPDFVHEMLDLIDGHMLVISPKGRHKIDLICTEISGIIKSLPGNEVPETRSSTGPSSITTPESTVRVPSLRNAYKQDTSPGLLGIGGDKDQHPPGTLDEKDVLSGEDGLCKSHESHTTKPEVLEALERVNKSFPYDGYRRKATHVEDNTSTDDIDLEDSDLNGPQRSSTFPFLTSPPAWR